MTPSASLLQALAGPAAPKLVVPTPGCGDKPSELAMAEIEAKQRDGSGLPDSPDPNAPRGRYLDLLA